MVFTQGKTFGFFRLAMLVSTGVGAQTAESGANFFKSPTSIHPWTVTLRHFEPQKVTQLKSKQIIWSIQVPVTFGFQKFSNKKSRETPTNRTVLGTPSFQNTLRRLRGIFVGLRSCHRLRAMTTWNQKIAGVPYEWRAFLKTSIGFPLNETFMKNPISEEVRWGRIVSFPLKIGLLEMNHLNQPLDFHGWTWRMDFETNMHWNSSTWPWLWVLQLVPHHLPGTSLYDIGERIWAIEN